MSDEPGAENIPCEPRDTDGFEATEGKSGQLRRMRSDEMVIRVEGSK